MTPVPLTADDLLTLDRACKLLALAGATDEALALGGLTARMRTAYFAALPAEEFSKRVPVELGPLRLIDGGAA